MEEQHVLVMETTQAEVVVTNLAELALFMDHLFAIGFMLKARADTHQIAAVDMELTQKYVLYQPHVTITSAAVPDITAHLQVAVREKVTY